MEAIPFCLSCQRDAPSGRTDCARCGRPLSAVRPVYVVALPRRISIFGEILAANLLTVVILLIALWFLYVGTRH